MKKIIGLTGTLGSGKSLIREFLVRRFNSYYVTLSSIIKTELERKKSNFNIKVLQDFGNELRKRYGNEILAKLAVEYLQRDKEVVIIDGIRNPGEVEFLRKKFGRDFVLIAVDAPLGTRFERTKENSLYPKSLEEFKALDERSQGKDEPEYGQQIKKCMEKADFTVMNDGTIEQLEKNINEIIANLRQ